MTTVLEEASAIVHGERAKAYGDVSGNWNCIAQLWSAYLTRRLNLPITLTANDVPWLNILQKSAREAHRSKRDNLVDVCGYAACAETLFPEPLDTRSGT